MPITSQPTSSEQLPPIALPPPPPPSENASEKTSLNTTPQTTYATGQSPSGTDS